MLARTKKKADPVDLHVGSRIRARRTMIGMSQQTLAGHLGLSFQQVQKYEKGTNRVGASRLQAIAAKLGVDASWFFEGAPGSTTKSGAPDEYPDFLRDFMATAGGIALARCYQQIESAKVRLQIVNMVASVAAALNGEDEG